jgi:hypothetical protein
MQKNSQGCFDQVDDRRCDVNQPKTDHLHACKHTRKFYWTTEKCVTGGRLSVTVLLDLLDRIHCTYLTADDSVYLFKPTTADLERGWVVFK